MTAPYIDAIAAEKREPDVGQVVLAIIEYRSEGYPVTEHMVCYKDVNGDLKHENGDDIGWPADVIQSWIPLPPIGIGSGDNYMGTADLLRRASEQLRAWHEKYGEHNPDWLPPAGDFRLLEDITLALRNLSTESLRRKYMELDAQCTAMHAEITRRLGIALDGKISNVPKGYVLVPEEPTPWMKTVGLDHMDYGRGFEGLEKAANVYRAMIAAATSGPQNARKDDEPK